MSGKQSHALSNWQRVPLNLQPTLEDREREKRKKQLDRAQKRRELFRASGSVFVGVLGAALIVVADVRYGPWKVIDGKIIAQIIPVILIAVILDGGIKPPPRHSRNRLLKLLYFAAFALFILALLAGSAVSIVKTNLCDDAVDAIQLAAISAGLLAVCAGVFFSSLGAVLPLKLDKIDEYEDGILVQLGGSNEFRGSDVQVSLNVLVPEGYKVFEADRSGDPISHQEMLDTPEIIDSDGFRDVELWNYTWRNEWGISAGDHRLAYFRIKKDGELTHPVYVVARADGEKLKRGRQEVKSRFRWPPADGSPSA